MSAFYPYRHLASCLLALSIVATPPQEALADEKAPISIGAILPLSGPFARYGEQIKQGLLRSQPKTVRYIFEDEGCDPKKAVAAYKKLAHFNDIRLFIGPWCGSPQSAVAPLLPQDKAFAMLGSSAPESVYTLSNGRMFSTQASIEAEGRFNAAAFNKRKLDTAVIVFFENQFSRAHEAGFRSVYNGKILDTLAYTSEDVGHLKSLALRVKQLAPKALYIPDAFPLMSGFLRQLRLNGVPKIPIFSVYSAQSDDVLEIVKQDGEGLIYSYYDIGEADALDFFPMRASSLLHQAIEVCGSEAECVRKKMPELADFDKSGTLASGLIHKCIHNGTFQRLTEKSPVSKVGKEISE